MHKKPHLAIHRAAALLMALAVALSAQTAWSQSPQANGKKYIATKPIILDQVTKQVRMPTDSEVQAMVTQISSLTNKSTDGLTVTTSANGTKSMKLDNHFSTVLLGRANADGSTELRCVTSLDEAVAFLGLEEVQ
jgi:hypothetical protein